MLNPLLDKIYYHCGVRTPASAELAIQDYRHLLIICANDRID
jgi:hypothetical protein